MADQAPAKAAVPKFSSFQLARKRPVSPVPAQPAPPPKRRKSVDDHTGSEHGRRADGTDYPSSKRGHHAASGDRHARGEPAHHGTGRDGRLRIEGHATASDYHKRIDNSRHAPARDEHTRDKARRDERSRHNARRDEHAHEREDDHAHHTTERDARRKRERDHHPPTQSAPSAHLDPPRASMPHVTPAANSDLYTVDGKGDPQNWTYKRLHKYSIPQYRRTGFGHVLGLSSRLKIDRDTSLEDRIYLVDAHARAAQRKERTLLKKPQRHQLPELRLSHHLQDTSIVLTDDFVPLPFASSKPDRAATSPAPDLFDQVRQLNDGPSSADLPTDPDLVYALSDHEQGTASLDAEARQRNAELSRSTKAEPADLQHWLALISHQRHLLRPDLLDVIEDDFNDVERRTLADLRIHIYEKACKCIPLEDVPAREKLFHSMFQEAAIVWDSQKYLERLDKAIREIPSSLALWRLYLDASQTNSAGLRFETGKTFYLQSLRNMHSAHYSVQNSQTIEAEDMYLYIILRYTTYLRESGYEELSLATWQALFEYHLFRPDFNSVDTSEVLSSFESFWESEAARFGEASARGWRNHDSANSVSPEDVTGVLDPALNHVRPFKSFAGAEKMASDALRFPGRTTDETESEDPFHIIFFSDLEETLRATPFLLSYPGLIDAFLCFMGLPLMPPPRRPSEHCIRAQTWKSDGFIGRGLLGDMSSSSHRPESTNQRCQNSPYSIQDLFSGLFPANPSPHDETPQQTIRTSVDTILGFVRKSLECLVGEHPDDEALAEYYLAFECRYYPTDASKTARLTLRKAQGSLRLYNACAMVEATLGRHEKAAHIWSGATKMKDNFPLQVQQDVIFAWQNWTWSDMQQGHSRRALTRLASLDSTAFDQPDIAEPSPSATLRVKKFLREGFDHALSQRDAQLVYCNVECLALLAYLSQPDALIAAMAVIDEHCALATEGAAQRSPHDATLELLHQSKASIISYHMQQQRSYKPGFIRAQLEASIELFPNNDTFLQLYKENEARFRVDDRVRAVLRDHGTAERRSALVRFSFEIDQEMSRFDRQASGSTIDSVRATFHRALLAAGSQVKHSKTLWYRWLQFEEHAVQQRNAENPCLDTPHDKLAIQKWKTVFLGGLHHLPWVKDWILSGLAAFDSEDAYGWDMRELKRLYNVLHEREMRVRVEGLEDVLDDIEEKLQSFTRRPTTQQ